MLEIVEPHDAERTLTLTGELDLATTPLLVERAKGILEGDGDVTLVLSGVSFIDSQGVRAFIQIARSLEGRGRLLLTGPTPEIRKLFDIVRIDDFPNIAVES
jgi:anti-anti-sigma factor